MRGSNWRNLHQLETKCILWPHYEPYTCWPWGCSQSWVWQAKLLLTRIILWSPSYSGSHGCYHLLSNRFVRGFNTPVNGKQKADCNIGHCLKKNTCRISLPLFKRKLIIAWHPVIIIICIYLIHSIQVCRYGICFLLSFVCLKVCMRGKIEKGNYCLGERLYLWGAPSRSGGAGLCQVYEGRCCLRPAPPPSLHFTLDIYFLETDVVLMIKTFHISSWPV